MMEGTAREKTREEKPGVSKNNGATQSCRSILDSGGCLNYDILRIIFEYLNARDLGSAAMVCRFWSKAANDEKSIRGPYCQYYTTRKSLYIKNIRIKPSVGFFFIPKNEGSKVNEGECTPCHLQGYIKDLLPENCEAIRLYAPESVTLDNYELLGNDLLFPRIVCAFLPQIPNVRIKSFELVEDCIIQKSAEYQEMIRTIVDHEASTSNDETSTCFMLFSNYFDQATAKRWASAMQRRTKCKESSVESTIFKRLFPKVPLAGCFGFGVFGKTTTVDEGKNEEEHECEKSRSWYNEYSTVFLILTYG